MTRPDALSARQEAILRFTDHIAGVRFTCWSGVQAPRVLVYRDSCQKAPAFTPGMNASQDCSDVRVRAGVF
ncbi:hypothetical protein, partial [Streptomyces sp. NPDC001880]